MRLLRHCGERHNQRTIDKARYYALDELVTKQRKYGNAERIKKDIRKLCGEAV